MISNYLNFFNKTNNQIYLKKSTVLNIQKPRFQLQLRSVRCVCGRWDYLRWLYGSTSEPVVSGSVFQFARDKAKAATMSSPGLSFSLTQKVFNDHASVLIYIYMTVKSNTLWLLFDDLILYEVMKEIYLIYLAVVFSLISYNLQQSKYATVFYKLVWMCVSSKEMLLSSSKNIVTFNRHILVTEQYLY